jgi:hypothetical protein
VLCLEQDQIERKRRPTNRKRPTLASLDRIRGHLAITGSAGAIAPI